MTLPSSTKSSSRPGETTRLFWNRPWPTRLARRTTNIPRDHKSRKAIPLPGLGTASMTRSDSTRLHPAKVCSWQILASWEVDD